ncbi:interleukin-1 receptor type 1 isoform X1 [Ochotona princeps]|uniref:interleukin-1 receptor type 1 isoform X1 n=2 Tax=Ochotona princeps TaxID=9978 RepID=UPI0027148F19|nr:interleukin-1 receptor type 1 isoform X1 [Ochotona princeps]XP_058523453.1 interleukin-1 receptor type 1 isoform X1 [Ochotona princeps]XP_058523454.1 interleukin-1 receptor type 1 isoform X1 [Ochotona princeps]
MKVILKLVCFIALLISLEADNCKEREEKVITVSSANEIGVSSCPLNPHERNGVINWYKNDSEIPISTDQSCNIHQHKDNLWFVPAKVEDSGSYSCTVRNSTYCLRIRITTKFVENEPNLCYSAQTLFKQRLPAAVDGVLVCPYMDYFKDENSKLPKIQWYKDCEPLDLDNVSFSGIANKLIVMNVTEKHRGKYTCHISYTYLGKQYPVTRAIEFIPLAETKPQKPVIMSPSNETKEVVLGSKIQLICNVSGHMSDAVYWNWNGSLIDEDDPLLAEEYKLFGNPSSPRQFTHLAILNISQVESRFYLYPFTCLAKNTYGRAETFIKLIYPVPDFHKHTIGICVVLTVVVTCSVFICKIFKVDIVLWYRDSCYSFLPKKAPDGKTYDAYILYPKTPGEGSTSNSDAFVFKVLPEVLEEQFGYKLFIYGRDDYVGEDIVEVTNENIKKSRRLIVILVRETSNFTWLGDSSEEQIAMYNALIQDGMKVVLLELEKIHDYEKMPESIKFIKQKHGVIRWSGDFKEGPQSSKTRFWKNVRYHMPAQRQVPTSKCQLLSTASKPEPKKKLEREVHLPLG